MRRGLPADSGRLSEIARAAKAHWGYPEAWLATWEPILRITPDYLLHRLVYVGVLGEEVVGFYALEQSEEDRWSLAHFWVDPSWHGRGFGRHMYGHALDRVRAIQPGVMVIEADPYAAGFYARMGARQRGTVPAPVPGDPDRALPVFEVEVKAS
jgi:GNAT superfamily N-acetyltransferase